MTKKELRKLYLEKRKALSEGDYAQRNMALYSHFFAAVDLSFVRILHTYLPIDNSREADTWMIVDRVRREFPHVRISIPRVAHDTLENIFYEGPQQLEKSAWGIPEPKQGVPTPEEKIDMIIVPLLAVDKLGHRIGYGKGYYDRLLTKTHPACQKVGFSLFGPVEIIDDVDAHDVALNSCVTPEGVMVFGGNSSRKGAESQS